MAKRSSIKKIALYVAGVISGAVISLSIQGLASEPKHGAIPVQSIRNLAEVYTQIKEKYYEDKADDKLLEGAMKGMVSSLDPHSEYLNKKDYAEMQEHTSGEFGGLGMEIGTKNGFIHVVAPIEDTPAERAGIISGDYITKIDGESSRDMTVTQAVKKMRGKPGTSIVLTISRKDADKPITLRLKRAIIKVKSVRYKLIEEDYGYIRISQFQEKTVESLNQAAQTLYKENGKPLKGLVLDLRDDPGGLLSGAVGVSAAFLPEGSRIVSTKGRDGKDGTVLSALPMNYSMWGDDPLLNLPEGLKNIPITVLINSGSASASEIVAGALQDHKRAVVVGTQSFGKGSVQTVLPLSNGTAVKLTTSLYYTPNNRSIQAQGIVPDVEVKDKNRTFESREADLSGHIGNPLGGNEVKGQDEHITDKIEVEKNKKDENEDVSSRREPNPEKDEQLKVALNLLKTPEQWKQSLGLAATKPVKKKENED